MISPNTRPGTGRSTRESLHCCRKRGYPKLCDELRRYLLTAWPFQRALRLRLGTVELTVRCTMSTTPRLTESIWDVGHQAYPHKIFTGRRDKIGTIRQKGGLHPFPWRGESEYDVLSVGHSSTSISAGIGIAVAAEKKAKIAAPSVHRRWRDHRWHGA
ncbi:1-deoxy-D-xylulose-5-phosphate synthase N-terminal domain-containing protein [Shigella flexneri]